MEGNVSGPLLIFSTAKPTHNPHFLSFPDGFVSSLQQLSCLFYSFDFFFFFARLDQRFPPDGPRSNLRSFFFLPSSSLYSAPCGTGLGMENVGRRYITTTRGPESTHTHIAPLHSGRFFHCGRRSGWMRRHFLPLFFLPQKLRQFSWGFVLEKKGAASLLFLFLYNTTRISFLF